ncbi:hypothetical protein N018_10750 [Pseudomonas syringae CC1557]|uniref:Uncharacterized protein n=1 Tax=Pseudomonas syringae CC1557 TaxID=1357279 RepID=W0N3C4_PSESX|nr:hypothetical protein N018_10750 [Pseudomonas syringae CC1557]
MIDPVTDLYLPQIERIHALQAGDVVAVFIGVGTSLVVGVNPAPAAKIMLGCTCIELIQLEYALPMNDSNAVLCH